MIRTTRVIIIGTSLGAAAAAGCSASRVDPLSAPSPDVCWPTPPEPARVRFLGQLVGSADVGALRSLAEQWNAWLYGPVPASRFDTPYAVAVHADGRRFAVADTNARCVHVLDLEKRAYDKIESCGSPPTAFAAPVALSWVGDALWVADAGHHAVAIIEQPESARWVAGDALQRPSGLAYSPKNDLCYVADAGAHAIIVLDQAGAVQFRFGTQGMSPGEFNYPSHLACAPDGTILVSDSLNFRIQRFGPDGSPLSAFGRKGDAAGDLSLPKGVAADARGNVWVVDAHFENVQGFTPDGQLLLAMGREGSGPGEFWLPAGLCIDSRDRMWVADAGNHRVQVFELLTP